MITAVLLDDVAARVLDISAGGCLLEAEKYLPVGTVGALELEFEGGRRFEWFRICRVSPSQGLGGRWLSGAEFLPLAVAGSDSLRGAIGRMRPFASAPAMPRLAGRSSGDSGNSARAAAAFHPETTCELADPAQKVVKLDRSAARDGGGNGVADSAGTDAPELRESGKGEVHMKSLFARLVRDDQGQDLIEYVLIGTLVSIAVVLGAGALGTNLNTWYTNMAAWVSTQAAVPTTTP